MSATRMESKKQQLAGLTRGVNRLLHQQRLAGAAALVELAVEAGLLQRAVALVEYFPLIAPLDSYEQEVLVDAFRDGELAIMREI